MTDETTARDRAEALPYAHKMSTEEAIRYLREEIAPQANREMLAGAARAVVADYDLRAPTADVAARVDELTSLMDEEMQLNGATLLLERLAARREALLAAAPEGVDAADYGAIPALANVIEEAHAAYRNTASPWTAIAQNVVEAGFRLAVVPEGVDAADERDVEAMQETIAVLSDPDTMDAIREGQMVDAAPGVDLRGLLDDEPDGMDLEAQGEMADQLAAAQAAIQRVRDLCAKAKPGRPTLAPSVFVADVLRALDGDTTEES